MEGRRGGEEGRLGRYCWVGVTTGVASSMLPDASIAAKILGLPFMMGATGGGWNRAPGTGACTTFGMAPGGRGGRASECAERVYDAFGAPF